jgi:flagellar hook assembly protein FlgD
VHHVVPGKLALYQNYPNPFNPTTTIAFWLPEKSSVTLAVYDVDGRLVNTLVDEELDKGMKQFPWNGTDSRGSTVSSGVYFYKLQAGSKELTRKMVLLK